MAVQAGLCLALSETPKDTFCHVVALIKHINHKTCEYLHPVNNFCLFSAFSAEIKVNTLTHIPNVQLATKIAILKVSCILLCKNTEFHTKLNTQGRQL